MARGRAELEDLPAPAFRLAACLQAMNASRPDKVLYGVEETEVDAREQARIAERAQIWNHARPAEARSSVRATELPVGAQAVGRSGGRREVSDGSHATRG
jgi:hypothetical protein